MRPAARWELMLIFSRLKNRIIARLTTRFPFLGKRFSEAYSLLEMEDVPWTPLCKPLAESRVALVTTAGVHHKGDVPFDMIDPVGPVDLIDLVGPVDPVDLVDRIRLI